MKKVFGLIGYPLSHSFSGKYFSAKFEKEGLKDHKYRLFEIPEIEQLPEIITAIQGLIGLNVTIPYKESVLKYIHALDESAELVGAVNVIKVMPNGELKGYNSDYYGFKLSLENWASQHIPEKALILGSGGASKAVLAALESLKIDYQMVSRSSSKAKITYDDLKSNPEIIRSHQLIINTTPLGMAPNLDTCPDLEYTLLSSAHFLYDLVYNPEKPLFLQNGEKYGAQIKNGLEMLHLQAEKSWEIWEQ